jgi:hypothetical protein
MKLSELIRRSNELLAESGDLEVFAHNGLDPSDLDPVKTVEVVGFTIEIQT